MKKVFIEGAGIAGLTTAARLAKAKYEVSISGEIYQNTEIDGFQFDHGQLLTLPAVFRDFFQKTGKHFGQVLEVNAKDPAFEFQFPDLKITFSNLSRSARLAEIEEKLGKAAALEWDKALKDGEYFWEQMRENYIEWEFSYLRANLPTYLRLRAPLIQNPALQRIMAHYATYLGYPAGIYKWSHLIAFAEESFGIWQIKGGIGALCQALKDRAISCGAKFESSTDYEYLIDATEVAEKPKQRLIGVKGYPDELPIRTVQFHSDGLTTDIYASKIAGGQYSLILTGKLEIEDFNKYAVVDQIRPGTPGDADNRLLTKIRTGSKKRFVVHHLDTLSSAGISGELLANAVRGIKNRPSHEH